jgi:excisionase family DNA binding protein
MTEGEKLLVNVVEAGRMLGIGRSKTHELIAAGDLPVVHIGRAARVPAHAVREFAEKLEAEQAATP